MHKVAEHPGELGHERPIGPGQIVSGALGIDSSGLNRLTNIDDVDTLCLHRQPDFIDARALQSIRMVHPLRGAPEIHHGFDPEVPKLLTVPISQCAEMIGAIDQSLLKTTAAGQWITPRSRKLWAPSN